MEDQETLENPETVDRPEIENLGTVVGPGGQYELYLKNEDLVDKLKLLNYEEGFLKMNKTHRPIQRHYFVTTTNVGEQFYLFTTLASWLIKIGGNEEFEMPQEFNDPNSTIASILSQLRAKEVPIDFAANKLKNGAGEHALYVLDSLADLALVHEKFQWQRMIPPVVEDEDAEVDHEEEEIMADEIEEAELDFVEDDDDAILVDLAAPSLTGSQDRPLQTILKSDINVISWREEVERVTPHLKITIRQDAKDWRMHLEQMNTMHKNMTELFEQVGPQLEQITGEVEKSLERIESRERTINQQLSGLLAKFKETQDSRAEVRERYKSASIGVTERTETLQRISEDIDQIKEQIEEQGAKTSDGAPMLKVKQALLKIEEDIERMNVQIGVIEQNLLQAQLRVRVAYAAEAYGAN